MTSIILVPNLSSVICTKERYNVELIETYTKQLNPVAYRSTSFSVPKSNSDHALNSHQDLNAT